MAHSRGFPGVFQGVLALFLDRTRLDRADDLEEQDFPGNIPGQPSRRRL
jgi:hypothetical protein